MELQRTSTVILPENSHKYLFSVTYNQGAKYKKGLNVITILKILIQNTVDLNKIGLLIYTLKKDSFLSSQRHQFGIKMDIHTVGSFDLH